MVTGPVFMRISGNKSASQELEVNDKKTAQHKHVDPDDDYKGVN